MIFLLLGFGTPILEYDRLIISVLWNYLKKVTKSGKGVEHDLLSHFLLIFFG